MDFFAGGITLPFEYRTRAALKRLKAVAAKARVPWSGYHAVVATRRALRRAAGAGIAVGAPVHHEVRRSLVAAGWRPRDVAKLHYVSMW